LFYLLNILSSRLLGFIITFGGAGTAPLPPSFLSDRPAAESAHPPRGAVARAFKNPFSRRPFMKKWLLAAFSLLCVFALFTDDLVTVKRIRRASPQSATDKIRIDIRKRKKV
jgi:hypothetical protein